MRTVSETSGTTLNAPTFELQGSQKKRKRKGLRIYLKRLQLKISLIWERDSQSSPGSAESPIQDKSKKKHAKTHINQTIKNEIQRKNIKSSKGKTTNNIQENPHKVNS